MRVKYCLATPAAAKHCGVSTALLEKLRCVGGGPIFCRLGTGRGKIIYRVEDLNDWLWSKRRRSTSDRDGQEQAEGPGDAEGPPARRRSTNDPGDEEQEEEDPDEASPSA